MKVVLEVTSDYGYGKRTWLLPGQMIDVGRTEHASFAVGNDPSMAPIHFQVSCDSTICTLRDLNTEQGTWVNGRRVTEVRLRDADRIEAGSTTMLVHIDGDATAHEAAEAGAQRGSDLATSADQEVASVGSWRIRHLPKNWSLDPGVGLSHRGEAPSIAGGKLREQQMPGSVALGGFSRALAAWSEELGVEHVRHRDLNVPGADEAVEIVFRFPRSLGADILQTQVCAAKGRVLGFATFVTPDHEEFVAGVKQIIDGLAFLPTDDASASQPAPKRCP